MATNPTKNDKAWEELFLEFPILEEVNLNGFYQITAKAINKFREARLMTKFDHETQLPKLFRDNNLTIQPISRSSYIIGRFDSYNKVNNSSNVEIIIVEPKKEIETIDPSNLYSESSAILCAYHAGIIDHILESPSDLTVLGRMSTGKFNYFIKTQKSDKSLEIMVENSQCEIDAGFEGNDFFAVVETKNTSVDDFLIRQLYYPFRLWTTKTRKKVIPIFMTYSNEVFSFYKYKFVDEKYYNSIELVSEHKFQITPNKIGLDELTEILNKTKIISEPQAPFPQADIFPRIVDLLMQLKISGNELTQEQITTEYDFNTRQTQYYTDAARYLGLLEKKSDKEPLEKKSSKETGKKSNKEKGVRYILSPKGLKITNLTPPKRNLALCECILENRVFNQTLQLYFDKAFLPLKKEVIEIMRGANLNLDKKGNTTIPRRAATVISWVNWMVKLTNE
jgi:hypothetical protein